MNIIQGKLEMPKKQVFSDVHDKNVTRILPAIAQ